MRRRLASALNRYGTAAGSWVYIGDRTPVVNSIRIQSRLNRAIAALEVLPPSNAKDVLARTAVSRCGNPTLTGGRE